MNKTVLVIAAHPDDELLGCGGTIRKHATNGDKVVVLIVCEGESSRNISQSDGIFTENAAKILGVSEVIRLSMPDQRLDTVPILDIITEIEKVVNDFCPAIIYTHHGGDINEDHKIVFDAMLVATRPMSTYIEAIYAFDTSSSTEWGYPRSFIPDTWVDISEHLEFKLKAMECYKTEIKEYPHPRSIEALRNKAHTSGNQVCMNAAETFMTVRRCIREKAVV